MPNIARDSHYVPQATLRRWSEDGQHVQAYRILVSHSEVPEWTLRSIRGLAYQRDLYTTFAGGQELDEFERWIAKEYEEPGFDAVNKLDKSCSLCRSPGCPDTTQFHRIDAAVGSADTGNLGKHHPRIR